MTSPSNPETGERCTNCLRPPWDGLDNVSDVCIRISGYWDVMCADDCLEVTITRIRSELTTLREQSQLERAVVEAALLWHRKDGLIALSRATDTLLAHRAQKGTDGIR